VGNDIDGVVAHILDAFRVPSSPPVDAERLAYLMGVSAVDEAELVEDGRLECLDGVPRILVRRGLSAARRRFTVGHELGHLLLVDQTTGLVARRALPVTDQVERFCDNFAAALLLPRRWITERYTQRPQNLSTLRHLANQANTSLSAAVVRLGEVLDWTVSLLRWRRERGRWRFLAGAAIPSQLYGHIGSAQRTSTALDEIDRRTSRDVRSFIPVRILNRDVLVHAQVSVRGRSALVLAELEPQLESTLDQFRR
jgi:hypothetical protein